MHAYTTCIPRHDMSSCTYTTVHVLMYLSVFTCKGYASVRTYVCTSGFCCVLHNILNSARHWLNFTLRETQPGTLTFLGVGHVLSESLLEWFHLFINIVHGQTKVKLVLQFFRCNLD